MIFFCEQKDATQAANPGAPPHELGRMISEQWKALPPDKGRGYSVLSATYADSKKNPTPARRKRERRDRDPKAPKSATSAYMYFSKHHRMLLKQENADLSFGDLGKTVGAMWKAATPEEKRPFEELAAEDRARYLGELSQYKEMTATLEKAANLELAQQAQQAELGDPMQEDESSLGAVLGASPLGDIDVDVDAIAIAAVAADAAEAPEAEAEVGADIDAAAPPPPPPDKGHLEAELIPVDTTA